MTMQTSPPPVSTDDLADRRTGTPRRAVELALVVTVLGGVLMAATSLPSSFGRASGLVIAVLSVTVLLYRQVASHHDGPTA
jgi:hypothetical protein